MACYWTKLITGLCIKFDSNLTYYYKNKNKQNLCGVCELSPLSFSVIKDNIYKCRGSENLQGKLTSLRDRKSN